MKCRGAFGMRSANVSLSIMLSLCWLCATITAFMMELSLTNVIIVIILFYDRNSLNCDMLPSFSLIARNVGRDAWSGCSMDARSSLNPPSSN